jgi:hypothetical protein
MSFFLTRPFIHADRDNNNSAPGYATRLFCGGWILVNSELYCFFVEKVYRINPPENYINKINILNIGREIAI